MGFYGNITNTSKTTFSFDLIYTTRVAMDAAANTDGVFLGRYVLVNYDEEPIKAYFNLTDKQFYSTSKYSKESIITPRTNQVYQDLHYDATREYRFYIWDFNKGVYQGVVQDTPYAEYFSQDVSAYGRGYDSTVWVKRYDEALAAYKYVMIAELNAVVPTLHLVVDKPSSVPVTPYFDRDTTNIDYYLHLQADYGTQVRAAEDPSYSDETIDRTSTYWSVDSSGRPIIQEGEKETVQADIYYNKAGFDKEYRHKVTAEDYLNTINYSMAQSGRLYGSDADLGVYEEGQKADDVYEWYIRLASLGNTISDIWDKIYGYRENDQKRYINDAVIRADSTEHLVSYDKSTLIGLMNTYRDLLGYYYVPLGGVHQEGNILTNVDTTVAITVTHEDGKKHNITYPALECLFYSKPTTEVEAVTKYYYYRYYPEYNEVISLEDGKTYYYKDTNGLYHLANIAAYNATNANGEKIANLTTYYSCTPRWKLELINTNTEDSYYGLLVQIHKLLGTNIEDERDITSVVGCINIIKDIISNINTDLVPGRLIHTNDNGIIETSETYFPSATWDRDEVLNGAGKWVSRFAQVSVLENSENSNQNTSKVNSVINGTETNVASVIISDNDKTNYNTSLIQNKKHTTNNLTLGSRNKWIELYGDAEDDSIEFKHSLSPINTRLRSEQPESSSYVDMFNGATIDGNVILKDSTGYGNFSVAENSTEIKVEPTTDNLIYKSNTEDQNDNRLTIPYLTVDNAGHIVELGTKNFNVPNTFKKIKTTIVADTVEVASENQEGISIAENISDTLEFGSQNRWLNIATIENNNSQNNKITIGHKLAPMLDTSTLLNGDRRTDASEIPTVYRYGLPANKTVADLDEKFGNNEPANTFNIPYIEVDKAGHIVAAETHTVEIPDNYTTITVGNASTSTGTLSTSGVAGETSDLLAQSATLTAETLTEKLAFNPSNKWIRLSGTNTKGSDVITIGHEIHNIIATTNNEDLDLVTDTVNDIRTQKATFETQTVRWDNAGHIIGHDTKTWTLPDAFHNIIIGGENTATVNATAGNGTLIADTTFDSLSISPSNKWIRLYGNPVNDSIVIGHLTQGTAGTYTGTDLAFNEFGGTVTVYGYETDNAGHIINNPSYTLTLPKGSYVNNNSNENATNVITGMSFNDKTGAITTTSQTIGTLLLTDYLEKNYKTATIKTSDNLINAISKLEEQIYNEADTREKANISLQEELDSIEEEITSIKAGWAAQYNSFDDLYSAILTKIQESYILTPKEETAI